MLTGLVVLALERDMFVPTAVAVGRRLPCAIYSFGNNNFDWMHVYEVEQ
jgi:hypothetical protein